MRKLANTKDMPREEWLKLRRSSLGGSDAAVILGLNPWRSKYTLWADKKGMLKEQPDNEAMRVGRDLEQYVADRFCEATGKKVRRRNFMFLHDKYDYISANVDREVAGENAGLECKTTNAFTKSDFEGGEIPLYYYCQCMHYMAVMGYEKMYLAVLVLGKAFYWFEIQRDEGEIDALIKAEVYWWNRYIIGDEVPEADGSESTSDTLRELYPSSSSVGAGIALYGSEDIVKDYKQAKAKEKNYKEIAESCKNQLAALMGKHEAAFLNGFKVTYKSQSKTSVDSKKLKAELPKVYEKYISVSTSRVLRIKEIKEE